jgi:hypothetical protein
MKRARFTEDQIITVLTEHEAGAKSADRKHGYPKQRCMARWMSPRRSG